MKSGLIAIGGAYVDINAPNFPLGDGLTLESEVVGQEYRLDPGGSAVNFARLCGALDVPTTFIGKAGKDQLGGVLADLLAKSQVEPSLITSGDVSTNVSFNMVNNDGKSIMAVVGTANQSLTADEVYSKAKEQIGASSYLLLGGCFKLKNLMPAFVELAEDAKKKDTKVVLDHGRLNSRVTDEEKEAVRQLAGMTDFYLPSADEFMQLWKVSSIEEGLKLLKRQAPGTAVIVKNSDKGAVTIVDGKVITVPAFSVKSLHTIGAGDSFNAGFIAAQYKGEDLIKSVKFGCATAALKISQKTLPTFNGVVRFIAERG